MSSVSTSGSKPLEDVFRTDILPALPHTAISLLQLSQDTAAGPADFARVIEADPGLMGQILKFVNSSYFGFSREIVGVQHALTLVGSRAITNFSLWNAVFSVIPNPQFGPFDLKRLWMDSLRRGLFARTLGKNLRLPDAEDLFAGALLQDMAIPLLLKELPAEYESLIQRRASEGRRLSGLENELFGWDHADAASMLAKQWKLPMRFVQLIGQHTQLDALLVAGDAHRGSACVALASLLPACTDADWSEHADFIAGFNTLCGAAAEDLAGIFADVDESTAEFAPLLKLPIPSTTLTDYLTAAN